MGVNREELRDKVNAALKKRAVTSLTADRGKRITEGLSSGSLMLNVALSGNPLVGYVWGRIVEIYGPEQGGKTTLALTAIREAQRVEDLTGESVPCLFVDAEHSLDTYYAESLGIDIERLDVAPADCGEDALNAAEAAIREGYKLVVVDSVAALTPRAEIEGEMGEAHVGLQARLMSQACRKLNGICAKNKATVIFINQLRLKIGVMFGNPETTPGGKALAYYSTYRLEVRAPRGGKKEGKTLMGYGQEDKVELATNTKVHVVKNKVFPPHRRAEFVIEYGRGIDRLMDTLAFLEWSGAFQPNEKTKSPVIRIPSKGKLYTAKGLREIIEEPEVQEDVLAIIREMADREDT